MSRGSAFLQVTADLLDDPERRLEALFILASFYGDELAWFHLHVPQADNETIAACILDMVKARAIGILTRPSEAVYARRLTDSLVNVVPQNRVVDAAVVAGRFESSGPGNHDAVDFSEDLFMDIEFLTDYAVKVLEEPRQDDDEERAYRAEAMLSEAHRLSQVFNNETCDGIALVYLAEAYHRISEHTDEETADLLVTARHQLEGAEVTQSVRRKWEELTTLLAEHVVEGLQQFRGRRAG